MELNWVEWVGYGASVMVALSLMMHDVVRLRWLNLVGCLLFVGYGVVIQAWPVALMNTFVAGVNLYHLVRLGRIRRQAPA